MSENVKEQLISTPTTNSQAAEADNGDPEEPPSQRDSRAGVQDPQEERKRQSPGPRTPEGKARSSQNSRKHGLFSRGLHFTNQEEQEQFEDLLEQLRQDRKPKGALQEMVVEQMATCLWRLLWTQGRISLEFRNRDSASWATTLRHFMCKADALELPVPGVPESEGPDSTGRESWTPWQCRELSLKLMGGDHSAHDTHEVKGTALPAHTDKKDNRSGGGTVERFELELKLGESLETLRRYESALKRELFQYIDCLERLQRRKPSNKD
jgi:hypothetical protein